MVVLAIVGILISILLPSLSKVREKGRTALCLSNHKQLTMLNFTFSSDHGNRAVGSGSYILGSNGSVEYQNIFNWMYFDKKNVINRLGPTEQNEIGCPSSKNIDKYERALMYNIDLRGGVWWGVGVPTQYGKVITDQDEWPGPAYNSSANYRLGGFLMKVTTPSDFIMFADAQSSSDVLSPGFHSESVFNSAISYNTYGTRVMKRVAFRHDDKATTAFTDGHVTVSTPIYENFKNSKIYFAHQ